MAKTLIAPDARAAAAHRQRLERTLTAELGALMTTLPETAAVELEDLVGTPGGEAVDVPFHPGLYAAYHRFRTDDPAVRGTAGEELRRLARDAGAYRERRPRRLARAGEADYADGCVRRALAQAPADIDRSTITSHLTHWSEEQQEILEQALVRLRGTWPGAYEEIVTVVAEVSLLGGHGLMGFTDFVAHGAVFISDFQLVPREGVDAAWLLAESLLHEATHTVCNAAGTAEPLIRSPREGGAPLVRTPLRADPRPLAGLTQQLVVLTRCSELYLKAASRGADGAALERRAETLSRQATSAAATLRKFEAHLTEAGVRTVEEAERRVSVSDFGDRSH